VVGAKPSSSPGPFLSDPGVRVWAKTGKLSVAAGFSSRVTRAEAALDPSVVSRPRAVLAMAAGCSGRAAVGDVARCGGGLVGYRSGALGGTIVFGGGWRIPCRLSLPETISSACCVRVYSGDVCWCRRSRRQLLFGVVSSSIRGAWLMALAPPSVSE
jgi:hypothetical protein